MDLAICVPLGSTLELTKTRSVESLAAFKATVDTSVSFHDKDHGLLWLRVVGEYARKQEDYQPCGKDNTGCFTETIKFLTLGSRWTWEEIGGSQRGGIGSTVVGIVLEFLKTRSVFIIGIKIKISNIQVCGSDGKTYENSCELEYFSCRRYWAITEVKANFIITTDNIRKVQFF